MWCSRESALPHCEFAEMLMETQHFPAPTSVSFADSFSRGKSQGRCRASVFSKRPDKLEFCKMSKADNLNSSLPGRYVHTQQFPEN